MAAALNIERVRDSEQTRRDRQRNRGPGPGQSSMSASASKKPKGSQGQRGQSGVSVANSPGTAIRGSVPVLECTHCGRRHRGECRLLTGGCFRCGATDHYL